MNQYYEYDLTTKEYIGPVVAEYDEEKPMPDGVTDVPPPQPMYLARFEEGTWRETAPKPEAPEGKIELWDSDARAWLIEDKPEPPSDPMMEILFRLSMIEVEQGITAYAEELLGSGKLAPEKQAMLAGYVAGKR